MSIPAKNIEKHVDLIEQLMNQIQQLQTANTKCLDLIKQLSGYKVKAETLENINQKLRNQLNASSITPRSNSFSSEDCKKQVDEIESEYQDKQKTLERDLNQIKARLLDCQENTNNAEETFNKKLKQLNETEKQYNRKLHQITEDCDERDQNLQSQIQQLQLQLKQLKLENDRKDQLLQQQKNRIEDFVENLPNHEIVRDLRNNLGAKVECFWTIISLLRPYIRSKPSSDRSTLTLPDYIDLIKKIMEQHENMDECKAHLDQYLNEIEESQSQSQNDSN